MRTVPRGFPVARYPHRTLPALLCRTLREQSGRVFLRTLSPDGEWTFDAFGERVRRAVAWLQREGLRPGDRVLLLSENSPDWQAVSLAAQALRAEPSALFASLDPRPAQETALRVRPKLIFVSTPAQREKLEPVLGELNAAVASSELFETPPIAVAELEALAKAVGEGDPFLLLFTSGTCGRPKGVHVSQGSFVKAIEAGRALTGATERDDALLFLPYAHIAGQALFNTALAVGHSLIHVARREDIQRGFALGPTYVLSVPLIYERIVQGVQAQLQNKPWPMRALVQAFPRILARKVRRAMGGRLRALFSGGAPTPPAVFQFFEELGIPYCDLYGMSESSAFIAGNGATGKRRVGSAGRPSEDVEIALADDGEVCFRGGTLMSGYLDEPLAETLTPEGWLRTGDLGAVDGDELRIVGRKKALFVLSTGKKVSPEPIELAAACASPVAGAVLLGDGQPFVSMAVFVTADADEAGLLAAVHARLSGFSEFERPKRLIIIRGAPQDHPHILTPTLKIRRDAFREWQQAAIDEVYAKA